MRSGGVSFLKTHHWAHLEMVCKSCTWAVNQVFISHLISNLHTGTLISSHQTSLCTSCSVIFKSYGLFLIYSNPVYEKCSPISWSYTWQKKILGMESKIIGIRGQFGLWRTRTQVLAYSRVIYEVSTGCSELCPVASWKTPRLEISHLGESGLCITGLVLFSLFCPLLPSLDSKHLLFLFMVPYHKLQWRAASIFLTELDRPSLTTFFAGSGRMLLATLNRPSLSTSFLH